MGGVGYHFSSLTAPESWRNRKRKAHQTFKKSPFNAGWFPMISPFSDKSESKCHCQKHQPRFPTPALPERMSTVFTKRWRDWLGWRSRPASCAILLLSWTVCLHQWVRLSFCLLFGLWKLLKASGFNASMYQGFQLHPKSETRLFLCYLNQWRIWLQPMVNYAASACSQNMKTARHAFLIFLMFHALEASYLLWDSNGSIWCQMGVGLHPKSAMPESQRQRSKHWSNFRCQNILDMKSLVT